MLKLIHYHFHIKFYESRVYVTISLIWIKFEINDFETNTFASYIEVLIYLVMIELSLAIDNIYIKSTLAQIVIAGEFNIHNSEWLPHSYQIDLLGQCTEIFSLLNVMSHLPITYIRSTSNESTK